LKKPFSFEMGNSNGTFTFATVHGAGHEVPAYRPMEALKMFGNVLTGKW
jgi:carboxypeptidase C (cathepsin A)